MKQGFRGNIESIYTNEGTTQPGFNPGPMRILDLTTICRIAGKMPSRSSRIVGGTVRNYSYRTLAIYIRRYGNQERIQLIRCFSPCCPVLATQWTPHPGPARPPHPWTSDAKRSEGGMNHGLARLTGLSQRGRSVQEPIAPRVSLSNLSHGDGRKLFLWRRWVADFGRFQIRADSVFGS